MTLLAIETATLVASVAVVDAEGTRAARERQVDTHSDVLLALIDEVLADAAIGTAALTGVAVGAGPGSFTGLRIAMATAKGLCFALDLPLWTVSSLASLALAAGARAEPVVAILDAKRDEVFAGCFRVAPGTIPARVGDELVLAPAELPAFVRHTLGSERPVLVGTGALAYPDAVAAAGVLLAGARATPPAAAVGQIALATSPHAELATAAPAYLRLSEAELTWRNPSK
jgi:tRNA threonylcarbamoyladenosine biosynthesis protein TsaB